MGIVLTYDKARSILIEGKKEHGDEPPVYEGEIPEAETEVLEEAATLVQQALDGREAGWESPAIDQVLFLYHADGGSPSDPNMQNGQPEPAAPPWRGYDKRTVAQIKKKLPKLESPELAAVVDYEGENKNRVTIIRLAESLIVEKADDEEPKGEEASPQGEDEEKSPEGSQGGEDGDAADESGGEADGAGEEGEDPAEPPAPQARHEVEHEDLIKEVTAKAEAEHLSIPKPLPKKIVEMPFDLTEVPDKELRQLHSAFAAYYARSAYVKKIERLAQKACHRIANQKSHQALIKLSKIDPETKKEKSVTGLKAEAEADENVTLWREREFGHQQTGDSFSEDADIFKETVTALSREWTMRHEEFEHSGSLSDRRRK